MNDPDDDDAFARLAFGRIDPQAPEQTLVHAPLERLPPLYLDVGTDEVLLDDSLVFARAAARAGVAVSLHIDPSGFHLRQLFAGAFAPGTQSLERAARWLSARGEANGLPMPAS